MLATRFLDFSVVSFVIYLKEDGRVASSPYIREHPIDGSELHRFNFTNIKLWEIPVGLFKGTELVALLPLVPLTQNGASHEIIEETVNDIERLVEDETVSRDLISLTITLAPLAFLGKKEEQDWLVRRFRMQHDILWDTPIYQLILEEGREEERTKSQKQERTTVQRIVQAKFPRLSQLAIEKTQTTSDMKKLQDLTVYLSIAQTEADARQYLLDVDKQDTNV